MELGSQAVMETGQHVKDELAEKCQKLFIEFLEEFKGKDGEALYLHPAEELIRPERNTLVVNFTDVEFYNQQLATTIQEEYYRYLHKGFGLYLLHCDRGTIMHFCEVYEVYNITRVNIEILADFATFTGAEHNWILLYNIIFNRIREIHHKYEPTDV